MKAIILAGGKGSRLSPITNTLPKPLIPLLDRPTITYAIDLLRCYQITDIFITIHYLGELIQKILLDGSDYGVNIRYFYEQYPLGTAGCIYKIKDLLENEPFIVIPGDAITDIDIEKFIAEHLKNDSIVSMALKEKSEPTEYGTVVLNDMRQIEAFIEKPTWDEVKSKYVNTGIYIINPEIFNYFPSEQNISVDWSYDIFPELIKCKKKICGFPFNGYWEDIGNISTYLDANRYLLSKLSEGQLKLDGVVEIKDGVYAGTLTKISNSVVLEPPLYIGNGVNIGHGSSLAKNTIINSRVAIGKNSTINSSIIHQNSYVDDNATLGIDTIICNNVKILQDSTLNDRSIVGANSMIGRNVVVGGGVNISNNQIITDNSYINEDIVRNIRDNSINFVNYYQIKGSTNLEITVETILRLALAVSSILPEHIKVLVGRDDSNSARIFKRSFISGIASNSIDIIDMEESTLPILKNTALLINNAPCVFIGCEKNNFLTTVYIYGNNGQLMEKSKYRSIENHFLLHNIKYASPEKIGTINYGVHSIDHYLNLFQLFKLEKVSDYKKSKLTIAFQKGKLAELLINLLADKKLEYELIIELFPSEKDISDIYTELSEKVVSNGSIMGFFFHKHGEQLKVVDNRGEALDNYELNNMLISLYKDNNISGKVRLPIYYSDCFSEIDNSIEIEKIKDRDLYFIDQDCKEDIIHQVTANSLYIVPRYSNFPDSIILFFHILSMLNNRVQEVDINAIKRMGELHIIHKTFLLEENKRLFVLEEIEGYLKDSSVKKSTLDKEYGLRFTYSKKNWIFVKLDKEVNSIHLWIETDTKEKLEERFKDFVKFLQKIKVVKDQATTPTH